ncbi:DUF6350 family protein [Bifidobacterium castoris]|uniref:Permease n=1 Tax=Bifidobacterium castoris TaxID=2306972 RepID=A0A430FA69_9BIFI|nr:DUF6350 family protein [Bifidobacterium castoris]RSX49702.1 permease [Bifidobacterium castoris]
MNRKLTPWLRGIAASCVAMLVYAVPLGFLMALVLLVAAMEEGGDAMSSFTVPLTQAVVLLSQGVGFHTSSIVVTVVPLLLTFLLVALIRSVFRRMGTDPRGYVAGLATWLVLDRLLENGLTVALNDSTFLVLCKGAIVFTLGFAWALVHDRDRLEPVRGYLRAHLSAPIRHVIAVGVRLGVLVVAIVLLCGLGTVIAWIALGHHAVGAAFDAMHMQTGSRILMCVMAAAWLPNLMLWAASWLFGAGFSIGDLATYTLTEGSASHLPALPIFRLFPQPVADPTIRLCVTLIPLAVGFILGLLVLIAKRGFGLRPSQAKAADARDLLFAYAYPVGAFCITSAVVSLLCTLLYALSDGALGTKHLASVGVDVRHATNATARPCASGLFLAWGTMLLLTAIVLAVRTLIARRGATESGSGAPAEARRVSSQQEDGDAPTEKKPFTARVVNSTPQPKEKQGDDNEPTATTGIGIGLP